MQKPEASTKNLSNIRRIFLTLVEKVRVFDRKLEKQFIDARDLAEILSSWGALNPLLDLNESGAVDPGDLAIVLGGWTI